MTASVPYGVTNLAGMNEKAAIPLFAGFLIGALVSTPLLVKAAHKLNDNKKIMVYCGLLMGILLVHQQNLVFTYT